MNYIKLGRLSIAEPLHQLVSDRVCPGTDVTPEHFFAELENIIADFGPRLSTHLKRRDEIQHKIDQWHKDNKAFDAGSYKSFLESINYLEPQTGAFEIATGNVDPEIASVAGAQLVVPLDNARFVLNAANARWGSLYDALYGTDAIPEDGGAERAGAYNEVRGAKVVAYTKTFLDEHFPLESGSHTDATGYTVDNQQLIVAKGSDTTSLANPAQFKGYTGDSSTPEKILLCKNNLHLEMNFDASHPIGKTDPAQLADVQLESAISTIMDCEDSVASVDVEDKCQVYSNWLGLMQGTLESSFSKGGKTVERKLATDRIYTTPDGKTLTLPGRSVLLVRNVGSQCEIDAVKYNDLPVAETLIDAMVTSLCAKHEVTGNHNGFSNSRHGSVYIVKPKMHGSEEVALANELFERVEKALSLKTNTLKMGIMDEERRTTVNLKNCINAARDRVVFINTGFLDRTGDDIHTSMEAGAMLPKAEIKQAKWLMAYEDNNVDCGLACGLQGKAQIGKGMWAIPDQMAAMLEAKIGHPQQGGSTAWVPSPTAATLHATHYFQINVKDRQNEIKSRTTASLDDILTIPLLDRNLSDDEIKNELDNNVQGILGYVARWVGQGIGCSKVPDINNIGLMEDCATLRISSQHIANWLHHGILSEEDVIESMQRLAATVDKQNAGDSAYAPMADNFSNSVTFQASLDLALKGRVQPNGYTEFILYERRQEAKAGS